MPDPLRQWHLQVFSVALSVPTQPTLAESLGKRDSATKGCDQNHATVGPARAESSAFIGDLSQSVTDADLLALFQPHYLSLIHI